MPNRMPRTAVIIGAGFGGLALANLLAKSGVAVKIYEQHNQPGGRAGQLKKDGFTFDTGPSWYLMPEIFEHYFDLLGEKPQDHYELTRLDPGYNVTFADGSSVKIHGDKRKDGKTFDTVHPGSDKILQRYLDQSEEIYRLAVKEFLYNNFASAQQILPKNMIRHIPRLIMLAGRTMDSYLRGYFKNEKLRQILEYPAVFLGASPFKAPALYSLMSYLDFRQGVFYPQGGMYKLVTALTSIGQKLGVEYHYSKAVKAILYDDRKATGIELVDGTKVFADIVVSNADLHFSETKLLPSGLQTYPEKYWRKREAGPSAILLFLGVKGKLPNMEHHNLFFTQDWQGSFDQIFDKKSWPEHASMYACRPSKTDTTVAPKGHENLFVLVPGPAVAELSQEELQSLADRYIDQLAMMIGVADLRKRIVTKQIFGPRDFAAEFNAWQGTALGLSHTLRQSAMFRPKNVSSKLHNLYYVGGTTVPGIGLPMCLIGAELVYKRIIGDKTAAALPKLQPIMEAGHER